MMLPLSEVQPRFQVHTTDTALSSRLTLATHSMEYTTQADFLPHNTKDFNAVPLGMEYAHTFADYSLHC